MPFLITNPRFGVASGGGGSLPFTDDWTGTDGADWNSSKWTEYETGGTISIQTNRGRMAITGGPSYGSVLAKATITDVADIDIVTSFGFGHALVEEYLHLWGRSSTGLTSGTPTDGYCAIFSQVDGQIYLRRQSGGGFTNLTSGFAAAIGTNRYWMRFQVTGTTLRARAWLVGDAEPGTWLVSTTDSTFTSAGAAYVQMVNGGDGIARTCDLDDITMSAP